MKTEFEDAARTVEQAVTSEIRQTGSDLDAAWTSGALAEPSPRRQRAP